MTQAQKEDVRVVVVDDDPDAAESLKDLLVLDGYNVFTAADAAEALKLVAEQQPLCVLLDIGLPGMDGNDLARALRAQHGADLVVVAVTGRSGEDDRLEAERAGVDYVLVKPLDPRLLRKMLPRID